MDATETTLFALELPRARRRLLLGLLRPGLGLPAARFHVIVDYVHVVERLGDLSKTQTRWSKEIRQAWLREQKRRLEAGEAEDIEVVEERAMG